MGDVNDGQVIFVLQLLEQLQNLRLNGHIKRGGRLVADEDFGVAGDGDGDDHALAHAAGELVRIILHALLRLQDTDIAQDLDGLFLCRNALKPLVQLQRFADLRAHGLQRVQGGHGILEYDGDFPAADLDPILILFVFGDIRAVIPDFTGFHPAVFVQHADKGLAEHGFARAGFPDDGKAFAFVKLHGYAAQRRKLLPAQGELHHQVFYRKDDFIFIPVLLFHVSCPP